MPKRFFILTGAKVQSALHEFRTTQDVDGDKFFGEYGPGTNYLSSNRPFERFSDYQTLLEQLQAIDKEKLARTHKGTPFYFLFWAAYDCRFYEKALFYLDAAISEDILVDPTGWDRRQAANYLWLKNTGETAAGRVVDHTKTLLQAQVDRFNRISGANPVTLVDFVEKFVKKLVKNTTGGRVESRAERVIATAFYTYLAESEERYNELKLRSRGGGSMELPLKHLFKGGLIFESLLKDCYPTHGKGLLGQIINDPGFQRDFPGKFDTSATSLSDILGLTSSDTRLTAFEVTSKLRNTTGHNLVWDDVFANPEDFRRLVKQQVNAILYIAGAKFL